MLKQKLAKFFRASSDSLTPQEEAVYEERMSELQCLSEFLCESEIKNWMMVLWLTMTTMVKVLLEGNYSDESYLVSLD